MGQDMVEQLQRLVIVKGGVIGQDWQHFPALLGSQGGGGLVLHHPGAGHQHPVIVVM